jgi:hypothetical protein
MIILPTYGAVIHSTFDALSGGQAWEGESGASVPLASQILAAFGGAGWTTYGIYKSDSEADFALVGGKAATWIDHSGRGNHATQGTDASRPTYSATAINGRPGLTFDGGNHMVTAGTIDLSAHTAYALIVLYSDSVTTAVTAAEFGGYSATVPGFRVSSNTLAAGALYAQCRGNAGPTTAASAASYDMTTPGVVSCTFDTALATNEAEIRHNGVNITGGRPENTNNATGLAAATTLTIGAIVGAGSGRLTGAEGAIVLAAGNTAIPVSAVQTVELLLKSSKGL